VQNEAWRRHGFVPQATDSCQPATAPDRAFGDDGASRRGQHAATSSPLTPRFQHRDLSFPGNRRARSSPSGSDRRQRSCLRRRRKWTRAERHDFDRLPLARRLRSGNARSKRTFLSRERPCSAACTRHRRGYRRGARTAGRARLLRPRRKPRVRAAAATAPEQVPVFTEVRFAQRVCPESAGRLASGKPIKIVALGPRPLTGPAQAAPLPHYPSRLRRTCPPIPELEIAVLNRGVNGDESRGHAARRWTSAVIAEKPDRCCGRLHEFAVLRDKAVPPHARFCRGVGGAQGDRRRRRV